MPAQQAAGLISAQKASPSTLEQQQQQQAGAGAAASADAQQQQQLDANPSQLGSAGDGTGCNLLPYGSTLHYPGCSCPLSWQKGSRVADQVDKLVRKAHALIEQGLIAPQRRLRVCYMLPHHNITGGMKCLVEHIRLLKARGHYTIAAHRWVPVARLCFAFLYREEVAGSAFADNKVAPLTAK